MENPYIAALASIGAWLLVAGPLHQASTELREHGLGQQRPLPENIPTPPPVSAWWWLIPPIAYWKYHAQRERIRREVLLRLPAEDVQRILAFTNTALGWIIVASGATFIAIKETWNFVESVHWPSFVTWIITAAALLLSFVNAALNAARTSKILQVVTPS